MENLLEGSDLSRGASDLAERSNALRGCALLPRGRENRDRNLSTKQIASAVFGLVPVRPGWAGFGAIALANLQPVGGAAASFRNAKTLEQAVIAILDDKTCRKSLVRLRMTVGETGTNSHGFATLVYDDDGSRKSAHFVPREAVSLLQPGACERFDADGMHAPSGREMSFGKYFFERLAREIEMAAHFPAPPAGDGSEYDAEEAQQARDKKLGATAHSRFLNIGIESQVVWPKEEIMVDFDRYKIVLMPMTKENSQSLHVDLMSNRLDDRDARTVFNRFLSIMSWCDDDYAVAGYGWSGNPSPHAVQKTDFGQTTAHDWYFRRKIPESPDAQRALALYREALNARHSGLISYAVLNFYKIIEMKNHGKSAVKKWFKDNFSVVKEDRSESESLKRFLEICGNDEPHEYIHTSCRIAVAHAGKYSKSDPDDAKEVERLHVAADIMRSLARHFIRKEFDVSERLVSGN